MQMPPSEFRTFLVYTSLVAMLLGQQFNIVRRGRFINTPKVRRGSAAVWFVANNHGLTVAVVVIMIGAFLLH